MTAPTDEMCRVYGATEATPAAHRKSGRRGRVIHREEFFARVLWDDGSGPTDEALAALDIEPDTRRNPALVPWPSARWTGNRSGGST